MANKLFDNILKVIEVRTAFTTSTVASVEIDFDIPRGYVVNIQKLLLRVISINEDIDGIVNGQWSYNIVLVKDPDDSSTTNFTVNSVQHDVIATHFVEVFVDATATQGNVNVSKKELEMNFFELDFLTARNMRMNIQAGGADAANATEANGEAVIYYTLEKINDNEILSLLDIL